MSGCCARLSGYCGEILKICIVDVQRQSGIAHCGFYAIANAYFLCSKKDPETMHWEQDKMRKHLAKYFAARELCQFPGRADCRVGKPTKSKTFEEALFYYCRMPYLKKV